MGNRKCNDALGKLYPYLDGEVTRYRKFRIKRHLKSCDGCGPTFSFESRFLKVIEDRLAEPPPPEMLDRLQQVVRDEREHPAG
ncbi:MAG: zf-HC2 domain-containing protein [Acidimicrobiia bacterium]